MSYKCSIIFHVKHFRVTWLTQPYQSRGIIVFGRIMSGGSCAAGAGRCLAIFGLLVLVQMPGALTSNKESDCLTEDDKGCEGARTHTHTHTLVKHTSLYLAY